MSAVGEVREVAEFGGPETRSGCGRDLSKTRPECGRDLSETHPGCGNDLSECCRSSIPVVSRANFWCRFSEDPGGESQY